MSRVLYREYRPRNLDEVKGQDHIVNALRNALNNNSVSHAYLFTGSHGVGKTSVARILAHMINGLEYTGENEHLDIIEIDAASNRRIDEIRELREKAFVAPTSAKYKVYIIDEVHMLTREAFNALLKTLEEPPEHAIFILATTEAHKVPKTIISRTQRFSFKPQDEQSLQDRLRDIAAEEGIKIDDAALGLIARHSNRSFRDAISLLDQMRHLASKKDGIITDRDVAQVIGVPSEELLLKLLDSLSDGDIASLFETTESLRQKGIAAVTVNQELLRLCRSVIKDNAHQQQIIRLMKFLLEHMNTATYESIEIALLHNMNGISHQPTTSQQKSSQQNNSRKMEDEESSKESPALDNVVNEKPQDIQKVEEAPPNTEGKQGSNAQWSDILQALKGHHNTLYGILKMSETNMGDDEIVIAFAFPFHEKQFLQTKHVAILKKLAKDKTGTDYKITTKVQATSKNNHPTDKKVEKKAQTSDLSNVSNIFSGAELLE